MLRTTFWGVRGSIPSPGERTRKIGGNTSCVEIRADKTVLIFDGGTGLRGAGQELAKGGPTTVHLFFSHVHWDHIQGFPFFAPAFTPGNTINLYGGSNVAGTVESALAGQMEYPNFPVKLDQLPSRLIFRNLGEGEALTLDGNVKVTTARGNHPGGVYAYRVDYRSKSVVYMTDTEHQEPDDALASFARGADLLIFDCMYTPEEYEGKAGGGTRVGWGHSTFVAGAELAKLAQVKKLVLYHHDPDQDDAAVLDKERRTRELFANSVAAYEGLVIDV